MRLILAFSSLLPTLVFAQNLPFTQEMLNDPITNKAQFEKLIGKVEIPVFHKNEFVNSILLKNDYVSAHIKNPKDWSPGKGYRVSQINLVFTKYPVNIEDWRTNYYELMANRYKELFRIDPQFNSATIKYYMILQTNCKSEKEASALFHGFEIIYSKTNKMSEAKKDPLVAQYLSKTGGIKNTEVYDMLGSFNCDSTLIVLDCTGSMHSYRNQVLMWLLENKERKDIYISLFNDDRSNGDTLGNSGGVKVGIFHTPDQLIEQYDSLNKTLWRNPDPPENDMEAILKGIDKFPFVKRVILFRDQESCVNDINLARCIHIPVFVLADDLNKWGNSHSLQIAAATGGALYVGNGLWITAKEAVSGAIFTIGKHTYQFSKLNRRIECLTRNKYTVGCEACYKYSVECREY